MSANVENNNLTIDTSQVPPASDASTSGTTSSRKKFDCDICGISVTSSGSLAAHVNGRKHFKKANPGMIFPKKVLTKHKKKKSIKDKTILTAKGNNLENIKENTMSKIETVPKNKKGIMSSPNLKKNNSDRHFNKHTKNHSNREEYNNRPNRYNSNPRNKWNSYYPSRYNYNNYAQNLHFNYDNNCKNYTRKTHNWNNRNSYDGWNNDTSSYQEKYEGNYSQQDAHPECNGTNNPNNLSRHRLYNDENFETKNGNEKNRSILNPDSTSKNRETSLVDSTTSSDKGNINLKVLHNTESSCGKTTERHFSSNNRSTVSFSNLTSKKGVKESDVTLNNSTNCSIESGQQAENASLPEGARQQDKRMFSENMTGRIAHWINPLNSRDKFEVKKLMTEFSKSRKKENLLKLKQHAENESLNDEEEAIKNTLAKKLDELQNKSNSNSESTQSNHKMNDSEELILSSTREFILGTNSSSQNAPISPKTRKRKKSSLSESNVNLCASNMDSDLLLSNFNSLSESCNVPKNFINDSSKKGSKNKARSHSSIDLPILSPRLESINVQLNIEEEDIFSKRKNSFCQTNKSKKHRCSSFECLEKCIQETTRYSPSSMVSTEPQMPVALDENCHREIYSAFYQSSPVLVKQEISRNATQNEINDNLNNSTNEQEMFNSTIANAEIINVEDLMKVFAVKNVTIKKEFGDPAIDVIKHLNIETLLSISDQSATVSTNVSLQHPIVDNSSISQKDNISDSLLPANCNKTSQNNDDSKTVFSESSPCNVYLKISNELKKLQKEEEDKRVALKEIDKELDKYNKIVNELTAKKVKLQTEEENLINRRNGLTCALSHCFIREPNKSGSLQENENSLPISSNDKATNSSEANSSLIEFVSKLPDVTDVGTLFSDETHSIPAKEINIGNVCSLSTEINNVESLHSLSFSGKPIKITKVKEAEDNDEVTVISDSEQTKNSVIPVIDLVESDNPVKNQFDVSVIKSKENSSPECAESFYDMKTLTVHQTVVNALKVFNDCLYTCSNDFTARRFNLEDPGQIVTYRHSNRNVVELCIEKFSDCHTSPLVFTLCSSDETISAFNAEDGTLIKTYYFDCPVASICSGKEKVFAGLQNGLILTCNLKDSKQLATNLEPIKSIASTFQGALHVLVVLSTNGRVSVRDVERNGLLIRYINAPSPTLFMNVNNNYVYLSSTVLLQGSDISSGTEEYKIKLTSSITGLAAYEHNIFTTSFSGLVRCYPNGKEQEVKFAYGAGNNALTSICVNQGWIFTGNRNGEVAVFQFEPETNYPCQFGKCQHVFIRGEDIERHVLFGVDHILPEKGLKCPWRGCKFYFKADWTEETKKTHLKEHVVDTLKTS